MNLNKIERYNLSIHLSNLALLSKGNVVKVGFGIDKNNKRYRINKKCILFNESYFE